MTRRTPRFSICGAINTIAPWGPAFRYPSFLIAPDVASRARQLAPMVSALSMIPRPWTAPTLFGNRMSLMFGGPPSLRQSDTARRNVPAVHPFADDRALFYRFSGGDTVATIRNGNTTLRIVRIDVVPLDTRDSLMKFAGNVFVCEPVTNPTRREDIFRLSGIALDLLAQIVNVQLQTLVRPAVVRSPHLVG